MHKPINHISGRALLIPRDDVDTDAIYPARFLNTIKRYGLGGYLFADWRESGREELAEFAGQEKVQASVLVAGRNFGCGSSREHAVWALADCGIGAVVALSFGDIFRSNCTKNGIVTAVVSAADYRVITDAMSFPENREIAVDLTQRLVKLPDGARLPFAIDAGDAQQLLSGKDGIAATLEHVHLLEAYEKKIAKTMPWLGPWKETQTC